MVFNIGDMIYSTLVEEFNGEVKVYPLINTDERSKLPFICYRRSSYMPEYTKDLYSFIDVYHYEVSVVSDDYKEGINLADRAINALMALNGKSFEGKYIQSLEVTNAEETVTEDVLFVQSLDFDIRITK